MAEAKKTITPEESRDTIQEMKKDILEVLEKDVIKKIIGYAPLVLSYAEKYAQMSKTEVDDRAVVIAEAIALLLQGGVPALLEAWKKELGF